MKPLLQSKPRPSNFKPVLLNSECSSRLILNLFSLGHHSNSVRDNRHVKKQNSAVGLLSNHQDAEVAVKELQKSGYNMNKLSVIGKDYHTEENVIGHYNAGDRMATWIVGVLEMASDWRNYGSRWSVGQYRYSPR